MHSEVPQKLHNSRVGLREPPFRAYNSSDLVPMSPTNTQVCLREAKCISIQRKNEDPPLREAVEEGIDATNNASFPSQSLKPLCIVLDLLSCYSRHPYGKLPAVTSPQPPVTSR